MNPYSSPIPPATAFIRRSPRRTILAEWRGIDLDPLEAAQKNSVKSASDLMPSVLDKMGLDQKQAQAEILRVWKHSIDPVITARAQPVGLRNGTLFVNVESSVWLSEIVRYRSREILDRLQNSFGKDLIARISYRAG
jgi:predicted nucleic acid-binding Zn ribbon protein